MLFRIKKTKRDLEEKRDLIGTCKVDSMQGKTSTTKLAEAAFGPHVLNKPVDCWPEELVAEKK